MSSPIMFCSVAVVSIGLMLVFAQRGNIILALFLCHWALNGFFFTCTLLHQLNLFSSFHTV